MANTFAYMTHVKTCLVKGYMVLRSWETITDVDVSDALTGVNEGMRELIRAVSDEGLEIHHDLYDSCRFNQLLEVCSFYRGIYTYKYPHDDDIDVNNTLDNMELQAYRTTIVGKRYFEEVAAQIALTYDIYHPLFNPTHV